MMAMSSCRIKESASTKTIRKAAEIPPWPCELVRSHIPYESQAPLHQCWPRSDALKQVLAFHTQPRRWRRGPSLLLDSRQPASNEGPDARAAACAAAMTAIRRLTPSWPPAGATFLSVQSGYERTQTGTAKHSALPRQAIASTASRRGSPSGFRWGDRH